MEYQRFCLWLKWFLQIYKAKVEECKIFREKLGFMTRSFHKIWTILRNTRLHLSENESKFSGYDVKIEKEMLKYTYQSLLTQHSTKVKELYSLVRRLYFCQTMEPGKILGVIGLSELQILFLKGILIHKHGTCARLIKQI